ncbi:MAG: cytochrome c biogenesis protein [Luteolibacter sp.]
MSSSRFIIGRWVAAALALLAFSTAIYHVVVDNKPKGELRVIKDYEPWSEEILESAGKLAVQDGGRVKPLSTYAGFTMLQLHGARSMKVEGERGVIHKLEPTAWLLDSLFRPALAMELPTFRVDNADALKAIGVASRGRRDRYSYQEIDVGREKLTELSATYSKIDSKKRDPVQSQIVDLEQNVRRFESLFVYMNFARSGILMVGSGGENGADQRADISAFMVMAPTIREQINKMQQRGEGVSAQMDSLLQQIVQQANFSKFSLFMFPPIDGKHDKWNSAGELIMSVMTGESRNPQTSIDDIGHLESLARSATDQNAFLGGLENLHEHLVVRSEGMDYLATIGMEYNYYQADWFLNAMMLFLIGSITALAMWTLGRGVAGKVSYWLTVMLTAAGALCCVLAIVVRCLIMHRPPIGNLYDTIIFIGATIAVISLLTELMTRRRFALGIGPILGTALILLARRYELGDASDHMDPLVAVLDSNYWLTTHVITITLGYSAGLLSAFLSAVYVLLRGLNLDAGSGELRRPLTRAVYGMLCFTLLLSLVGTVLGGIWANDSWGRFWGWDPKENGALLIVLWTLAILHARLGGYLKEWGIHIASLFTAVIVTFSWWHVNFLGVGLHNYGFTAGKNAIWVFYATILATMIFALVAAIIERESAKTRKA